MTERIALCTTTFYDKSSGGEVRKKLALAFAAEAREREYPVFVVDGGTGPEFVRELKDHGAQVYAQIEKGLGGSRRQALGEAQHYAREHNIPYVGWSEPEKAPFVKSIGGLIDVLDQSGAELVVPARKSLKTYPPAQQYSEQFANQLHTDAGYVDQNGKSVDTFFGPRVWRREASPFFQVFGEREQDVMIALSRMRIEKEKPLYTGGVPEAVRKHISDRAVTDLKGSDHMIHMPTCLMILQGRKVLSVLVDYEHPAEQTELETREQREYNSKRLRQLNAIAEQYAVVQRLHDQKTLDSALSGLLAAER